MLKFIVLSTQRSGSTLFVRSLDSHPQIGCFTEIFRPGITRLPKPPTVVEVSYEKYWDASLLRRFIHRYLRGWLIAKYLDTMIYTERPHLKAQGFKLMYNQHTKFPEVMEWIRNHNVKVIHNIRENMLKVLVSRKIAKLRGIYISKKPQLPIKITLDPTALQAELSVLISQVEKYRESCKRLTCHEVLYEPFVHQQEREARKVLDFLNVPYQPLHADIVKMNSDSLQDSLENYQDVAETLKNTEFEKFLD